MDSKSEAKFERLYSIDNGTSLGFDPSGPYIIASWVGFTMSEEFRSLLEKSIELIEEKVLTYNEVGWISDFSKGEMVVDDDIRWTVENWNGRAHKAGLRYNALIIPENSFLEVGASDYTETTEKAGEITVRQFLDMESAKAWLDGILNGK